MSVQAALFELPEASTFAFAVVPACGICGATGERIVQDGEFDKPHLWALIAIAAHEREMHPELTR